MNKINRKKDRIINKLDGLLEECTLRDERLEDELYRDCLRKLKNYDEHIKRHFPNTKGFESELNHYITEYLNITLYNLESMINDYELGIDPKFFMDEYEEKIIDQGLQSALKESGVEKEIYKFLFNQFLPKHPKDEYPETRKMKRKFVVHVGPTNSGKTFESLEKLKVAERGMYLAPLRLLALEIYEKFNIEGVLCSLLTGEEEINVPFSRHTSSTIEKVDLRNEYDLVVIDEGQLIADHKRGDAWFRSILGVRSKEIHICCSLNSLELITRIIKECGDELSVVHHKRMTPLITEESSINFPDNIKKGDGLITFSRDQVLSISNELERAGFSVSVIYGNLPPETRRKQVELFNNKETDVVVATDAIGMGLNLPVRRIVFTENAKFDGSYVRELTSQEVKQIAGRAGRKGLYDKGYVTTILQGHEFIKNSIRSDDPILKTAMIKPTEDIILQLNYGSLKERLKHWVLHSYDIDYIEKVDITDQVALLDEIPKKISDKMSINELYKAIYVPFDFSNDNLVGYWLDCLEEISTGANSLSEPKIRPINSLHDLEMLYQEIEMYYSVSKKFELDLNEMLVTLVRNEIALEIHNRLVNRLKKERRES